MKVKMLVGKDKGKVIDLEPERVQCIASRGKGVVVKESSSKNKESAPPVEKKDEEK